MPKKKTSSSKNKIRPVRTLSRRKGNGHPLFIFALLLCMGFFIWHQKIEGESLIPSLETDKSEIHNLPPQIKKKIAAVPINQTIRVPILMYHYVEYVQDKKDTIRQSLDIIPYIFEQQVKTLKDAGYTFLTAKDLGDILDGKMPLPKNPILLTFDDGHWDLDTDVLPILKKYNVKATAYIIPGFLGGSDFLSQSQLQDVINSNLIDVGAHTIHHAALANRTDAFLKSEVDGSKQMLEDEYHIHVVSFAYPFGSFDQKAADEVKTAGFTTAVSTVPGIMQSQTNRFYMYRIRPGGRIGQELLTFLQQSEFKPW